MPPFHLGASVSENVANVRVALGSATRALSRDDLAKLITERHPTRVLSGSSVERWEKDGVEPDYHSARIMAQLVRVSFEEFAFGVEPPPTVLQEPTKPPTVYLPQPTSKRGRRA